MKTSKKRASAYRFLSVHLENWRNFTSVDVDLSKRVFLVGPNASGKSNFLDVFRFLRDIVLSGGFQQAVTNGRNGVSLLRCLAARREIRLTVLMKQVIMTIKYV